MTETPAISGLGYPADNLSRFRYHTGATLRPLRPDEPCPVLFRDLGPTATALFLRGGLRRLAGPLSPIVYMRTAEYEEPYTDYERIGRLVFLRPLALHPWHAGVPTVYVANAARVWDRGATGYVPGDLPLASAAEVARGVKDVGELRDAFGGRSYDEVIAETTLRLERLEREFEAAEELAAPVRAALQAKDESVRERMAKYDISESDLCAAWHHVPRERRVRLVEGLRAMARET